MIAANAPVLVVAAHPDDEVLGCGGTVARLAREGAEIHIVICAEGATSRNANRDPTRCANELSILSESASRASAILGAASVEQLGFPDNRMDSVDLLDIVKQVEAAIAKYCPRSVLTHHSGDVNIDHQRVHDAVIAACRPQPGFCVRQLLFFETPSSTEWRPPNSLPVFAPSYFVDIGDTLPIKLQALAAYQSEVREYPHPRSIRAVEHLACWRGATVGCSAAEAFELGRLIL